MGKRLRRAVTRHLRWSERFNAYIVELDCGHTVRLPNTDIKEAVCSECSKRSRRIPDGVRGYG